MVLNFRRYQNDKKAEDLLEQYPNSVMVSAAIAAGYSVEECPALQVRLLSNREILSYLEEKERRLKT